MIERGDIYYADLNPVTGSTRRYSAVLMYKTTLATDTADGNRCSHYV